LPTTHATPPLNARLPNRSRSPGIRQSCRGHASYTVVSYLKHYTFDCSDRSDKRHGAASVPARNRSIF
jgi:hypothetical protein